MVVLLTRAEGTSHEEFARHLREEHVPIAEALPGLQRYSTSLPNSPENSAYDGLAEATFRDMSAVRAAFDSEVGERVLDDVEAIADMDETETLYLDEAVHVDETVHLDGRD